MASGIHHNTVVPIFGMVVVQIVFAGMNIMIKLAINDGVNMRIFVAYRSLFSTACLAPMAFFMERGRRPNLTWTVLFLEFLCGFFGVSLANNLYVASMGKTSATFVSAMTNLAPAITFLMAIPFSYENLQVQTQSGKSKIMGTLLSVGGAMLLTFYKGVEISMFSIDILHMHHQQMTHEEYHQRVLGSLLAIGNCMSYAIWLIIQTRVSQIYPCYYTCSALMSMMGSIQTVVFALCTERNWSEWNLGWNVRLLAVAYLGLLASGLMLALIAWCVQLKGPVFASCFNPLMLVLVVFSGSILLNEKLHLGSILGGGIIVIGLYLVLWGKAKEADQAEAEAMKERERTKQLMPSILTIP